MKRLVVPDVNKKVDLVGELHWKFQCDIFLIKCINNSMLLDLVTTAKRQ